MLNLLKQKAIICRDLFCRMDRNLNPIASLVLSLKYCQSVSVFKQTKLSIAAGATVHIDGTFAMNLPWEDCCGKPSTLLVADKATLLVRGPFRIYTGGSIIVSSGATLILGSGFLNNNGNICCFRYIEIGNDVKIS